MCILHKNQSKSEEGNEAGERGWGDGKWSGWA